MIKKAVRILGIDPGFGRIGWGMIEKNGSDWKYVVHGCIETNAKKDFVERLEDLYTEIQDIIKQFEPDCSAVEELFFYKNVTTAIKVGQARGVILLSLRQAGLPVWEYTPLQVKQAVTGYGRAEKQQIQKMVCMILGMPKQRVQDDAADALAVAVTCGNSACLY